MSDVAEEKKNGSIPSQGVKRTFDIASQGDQEETVANVPLTKKTKREKKGPFFIYTVTFTEFRDDYKARGDDWSNARAPLLFTSHEKATRYVDRQLYGKVCEYLEENQSEDDCRKYWHLEDEKSTITGEEEDEDEDNENGSDHKDDDDDNAKEINDNEEEPNKVLSHTKVTRDLDVLIDRIRTGEFVPHRFGWDISTALVDEEASASSEDDEDD